MIQLSDKPSLVTILTPVYNGEKYLTTCIESVLAQTYQHWEYVIINNCSTDRTLAIAERYAGRDKRIRIHNNELFATLIGNHNIAVAQLSPQSTYCKVVHADDWLFPECLEQMVALADAHPDVGVVSSYGLRDTRVAWDGLPYPSRVTPGHEICRQSLLGNYYVFGSPTTVMFRADLVRKRLPNFYNDENINAADGEACYDLLQESNLGFVHQVLTFTREHEESQSSLQRKQNAYIVGQMIILRKYGPIYLNRQEYHNRLKWLLTRYYRYLGQSLLQRREKNFWQYHRDSLTRLGLPLRRSQVLRASLIELYYSRRASFGKLLRYALTKRAPRPAR